MKIQFWLKGDFFCTLNDVPIPRFGDLVKINNTEFYKVKAVLFTYEIDSCVVDVYLIEVEK